MNLEMNLSIDKIGCKFISEERYKELYDLRKPKKKPTTTEGNKI